MRLKNLQYATGLFLFALVGTLLFTPLSAEAQDEPERRKSPLAMARTTLGDAYVKVTYGQPYKRGRQIFGELVPYGEVWRTGANEATELTTTEDIQFGDQTLKAGTYALFTIPGKDKWTIIVNRTLGQWGAYSYSADDDIYRFTVPVDSTSESFEAFTMSFDETEEGATSTNLNLMWDKTKVSIPVSVK